MAINTDERGRAICGHHPIACFTVAKPTLAKPEYTAKQERATYRFASAVSLDAYIKETMKYAPAFGGFCAMGTVFDTKLDGDPGLWRIVDGRLSRNVGEPAQTCSPEDKMGNVAKATENWPRISVRVPKRAWIAAVRCPNSPVIADSLRPQDERMVMQGSA